MAHLLKVCLPNSLQKVTVLLGGENITRFFNLEIKKGGLDGFFYFGNGLVLAS
jgi:hypothetical protein